MFESRSFGDFRRVIFARRNLFLISLWPALCVAIAALLWGFVHSELASDKNRVEDNMLNQAAGFARAVAKGLSLSVMRVDELSQEIRSRWEDERGIDNMNASVRNMVLERKWLNFIGITDRHGRLVVSSDADGSNASLAEKAYFQFHVANRTRTVHISRAATNGQTAIDFTRRVESAGGKFNGVVVLGVNPAYLTSFYDVATFGKRGYLSIWGSNGVHYAAKMGGVDVPKPLFSPAPDFASDGSPRLITNPDWLENQEKGVLTWQQIAPYPLIVVIGIAGGELLGEYDMMAATYLQGAAAASWFLLASGIAGTLAIMLLLWRKHQAHETRDAYRLATEGANEGFFFLRALHDKSGAIADFIIEDCNQTGAALGGVSRDQLIGIHLSELPGITDLILPSELPAQIDYGRKAMAEGIYQDEWGAAPASSFRGLWLERKMVRFGNGLALTMRNITVAKAHERHLLAMAHEDTLTKLPNRHWLMNFLPDALARTAQRGGQLAVLFIDIDNFKHINDTLGHAAGDALLHVAAMRLQSELRPGDNLARLGGDEFTIVLEQLNDTSEARVVAERIVASFKNPIELGSGTATVGASIGISLFPADGQDMDMLLRHADIAMYAAKAAGKGRYRFYDTEQYQTLMERISSLAALENAVQRDQFVMRYQPRYCSTSGEICGIEALVRWQNPDRGLLLPQEFIALAESSGLILLLGKLVMEKVCAQIEQWSAMHLAMVPVSFNVSASEFNGRDVPGELARCIAHHRIEPGLLEIELTETALVDEKGGAANALARIREMSVKCLVDDFGTGFSSLSQLQRFDTDILKIDQSFTAELGKTKKTEAFFRAIVSLAHALDMGVVAEGVETIEQLHMLQQLQCEEVQGYYLCSPVAADEMAILLQPRIAPVPGLM